MNAVSKITRAGFAWLTTITMLVASLPHIECRCPNGLVKPFCFGVFCSSSCCCGDDVGSGRLKDSRRNAGTSSAGKGRPACCCGLSTGRPAPQDSGSPRLEGKDCQRTLAQQQQFAPSVATRSIPDRGVAHAAYLASLDFAPLDSAPTGTDRGGMHLAAPPPPDLVIVLQRFLI